MNDLAPAPAAERPEHAVGGTYTVKGEEYVRDQRYITTRITRDGGAPDGGLDPASDTYPVEAGRYRLVAARACPWANRSIIVRRLLGLEDAISLGLPGPTHDERSWTFDLDPDGRDPVLGIERLQEAFFRRDPGYPRGITVPAIVDTRDGAVVTNDFAQITLDLITEWAAHQRPGAPRLLPDDAAERAEMDAVMRRVYTEVNNGVYRCGFAGSQEAYEAAYDRLFTALDWLEERLAGRRYLMGDHLTEADVRLFTTLVRFDAVYHGHFKCNRNKLTEMPTLWAYARDLFQTPGFGDTVDFVQIKQHYHVVHQDINPTQIVPAGPALDGWLEPHGRERLGDRTWGEGGTAPGPVREGERVTAGHNPLYPA
jgi:putative glutathione S-transferase